MNHIGTPLKTPIKVTDGLAVADASQITPLGFLDALGLSGPEKRAAQRLRDIRQCIAAITNGNTYGWPPLMVAECREIMAGNIPDDVKQLSNGRNGLWL